MLAKSKDFLSIYKKLPTLLLHLDKNYLIKDECSIEAIISYWQIKMYKHLGICM